MPNILIISDYMSGKDSEEGYPLSDGNGKMFRAWLHQSGISPRECTFLNVFPFTPKPRISMASLVGDKAQGVPHLRMWKRGKYLKAEYGKYLQQLWDRINYENPNLIITLGDTALWATCHETSVKNARGRIAVGNSAIPNIKLLPTYHPRQVSADWTLRPIVLADLDKAKRESLFPEVRRPQRFIHLAPSLEDMEDFCNEYIVPSDTLSVDIETKQDIITCVGFAPSSDRALVVPFYSEFAPDQNYWPDLRSEAMAWAFVRRILSLGKIVFGQNYQFDAQRLWFHMGIKNPSFTDDTMLMHHALQIEMQKGLGFLASIYTDEVAWKFMHKTPAANKSNKRD